MWRATTVALALMVAQVGSSGQGQTIRPETAARVQTVPGGMMLVRDVTGDYRQHPRVFAEMMRLRDADYVAVGDCFGIYPVDPDTVTSPADLRWRVGVRVVAKDGGRLRKPPAPYRLETLPTVEAAVLATTVKSAALDGLSLLRWLPEHGYVQVSPTRMEYQGHEGDPMLLPARIIVPIKKRVSGLVLPPAPGR